MTIRGMTILVLEDEPIIALALEDMLIDGGAEPVMVDTVEAGLAMIDQVRVDAAILDLNIHGAPSYPLADALRARGVPFVFATGYGGGAHGEDYASVPTVSKPYGLADLERAIERASQT